MVKQSFNVQQFLLVSLFIIVLGLGSYLINSFALKSKTLTKITPTPPHYGPQHPCKEGKQAFQSFHHIFDQLINPIVNAHSGEGYDRWGIKVMIPDAYPCKYIITFNVEKPYEDWSYTQEVNAYAFPDQIVRFQPPAEVATASISLSAITTQGETNRIVFDSLEMWDGIHQFPIDPQLGEVTLSTTTEEPIRLRINQETKLFEIVE